MNPSRILPDLQCSLLCEDVRQEVTGNFMVNGVLSLLRVPKTPVVAWRLFVFNRWVAGVGQFLEVVRLLGPDQSTVMRKGQTQFVLENPAQNMTNVTLFTQVQFPAAGVYFVEVLVDEVMKLRYPLPVVLLPPNAPGGGGGRAQAAPAPTPAPDIVPETPPERLPPST
jgi:hypothetical protein